MFPFSISKIAVYCLPVSITITGGLSQLMSFTGGTCFVAGAGAGSGCGTGAGAGAGTGDGWGAGAGAGAGSGRGVSLVSSVESPQDTRKRVAEIKIILTIQGKALDAMIIPPFAH